MAQTQGTVRSSDNKKNVISTDHKFKQFGNYIGGVHLGGVESTTSVFTAVRGLGKTFPVVK